MSDKKPQNFEINQLMDTDAVGDNLSQVACSYIPSTPADMKSPEGVIASVKEHVVNNYLMDTDAVGDDQRQVACSYIPNDKLDK